MLENKLTHGAKIAKNKESREKVKSSGISIQLQ
jgi:hypothetical protein